MMNDAGGILSLWWRRWWWWWFWLNSGYHA